MLCSDVDAMRCDVDAMNDFFVVACCLSISISISISIFVLWHAIAMLCHVMPWIYYAMLPSIIHSFHALLFFALLCSISFFIHSFIRCCFYYFKLFIFHHHLLVVCTVIPTQSKGSFRFSSVQFSFSSVQNTVQFSSVQFSSCNDR
jgi:hypothetical protein